MGLGESPQQSIGRLIYFDFDLPSGGLYPAMSIFLQMRRVGAIRTETLQAAFSDIFIILRQYPQHLMKSLQRGDDRRRMLEHRN